MPCTLWLGSLAGSRRGKNMLFLCISKFGLANTTVRSMWRKRKGGMVWALSPVAEDEPDSTRLSMWSVTSRLLAPDSSHLYSPWHVQRRKVTAFSFACSIQYICRKKQSYTKLTWRLSAAETVKVHRSCSLSQGHYPLCVTFLQNYHTIQIPPNQARNCFNYFISIL